MQYHDVFSCNHSEITPGGTPVAPSFVQEAPQNTVFFLRAEQILVPTPSKTRKRNEMIRLVAEIRKYGLAEPFSVRQTRTAQGLIGYTLTEDAERFRAAMLVGMSKFPCVLQQNAAENDEITDILAQIQGKHLHMFETAAAYRLLIESHHLTQGEVAERTGTSQSAVANKLRLLQLSRAEQQLILQYRLTERHARALLRLKSPEMRAEILKKVIADKLTVAATEILIEGQLSPKARVAALTPAPSLPQESPVLGEKSPESGTYPSKFALKTLQPLYNSLERTLQIFRKTGKAARMSRTESEEGVLITIEIHT